jgi:uncharacterized LabA/DUF88 family protein
MNRTAFLIDGFNLYHSLKQASRDLQLQRTGTRWLNLRSLCETYRSSLGKDTAIVGIYYFSALATHLEATDPGVTQRHKAYIECLQDTGIEVEFGRFKEKIVRCHHCGKDMTRHEEKETDVAISLKLIDLFIHNACDTAILVTGDTDLAPTIRMGKRLFPTKRIGVGFPHRRHNEELKLLADLSFQIRKEQYVKHQFANPYVCSDGRTFAKPRKW